MRRSPSQPPTRTAAVPTAGSPRYVGWIVDVPTAHAFDYRQRPAHDRQVDQIFSAWVEEVPMAWQALPTRTVSTESQGLWRTLEPLPLLLVDLWRLLPEHQIRVGVGLGEIWTPLRPLAVGMDGPVWHAARDAIQKVADHPSRVAVAIRGIDPDADRQLTALSNLLLTHLDAYPYVHEDVPRPTRDVQRPPPEPDARHDAWLQAYREGVTGLQALIAQVSGDVARGSWAVASSRAPKSSQRGGSAPPSRPTR